jgi:hypothetical protein
MPKDWPGMTAAEVLELVHRGQMGDESVMPLFRALMDAKKPPIAFEDTAKSTVRSVVEMMNPTDLIRREIDRREIQSTAAELAGPNPTPIERMLTARVALCWHLVNWAECAYAQNLEGMSFVKAEHYQKRIDRIHRRHLSAVKALVWVRRAQQPAGQASVQPTSLTTPAGDPADRNGATPQDQHKKLALAEIMAILQAPGEETDGEAEQELEPQETAAGMGIERMNGRLNGHATTRR